MFRKNPSLKETQRDNRRALNRVIRDVSKEIRELEIEERKLEDEIRQNARAGNKETCTMLAKQLVKIRQQKTRITAMNSKVRGVSSQNTMLGANVKLAEAISTATKTMNTMNSVQKPEAVTANMKEFKRATVRADMTDEIISSALDEILTESGDEEESDNVIQEVLSEIGIGISEQLSKAKPAATQIPQSLKTTSATDKELEDLLEKIKAS